MWAVESLLPALPFVFFRGALFAFALLACCCLPDFGMHWSLILEGVQMTVITQILHCTC
jgi:hypothetical protein